LKVNISVHGRWHAFELANGLHSRGALGRLATTYPKMIARRFLRAGIEVRAHSALEVRRRLYDRWRIGAKPDLAIARAFGRFAARAAVGDADILVGWSAGVLEAIAPARAAGMKVVVERGSTHIRNQVRILTEAYEEFGLDYRGTEDEIVARELAEYEGADAIAVPTDYAARTFVDEGVPREKLIVNPYGVDLGRFAPATARAPNRPIRVLCVGRVGIQKGIPWLLDAFAKVGFGAELHLVGPVDDEAATFLGGAGPTSL
jgi:glycosyltransferase involved in cell wall biosynthesis